MIKLECALQAKQMNTMTRDMYVLGALAVVFTDTKYKMFPEISKEGNPHENLES